MTIERNMFIIECDKNINYISQVIDYLETKVNEIMNFFELNNLKSKKKIIVWNNLDLYKKHIEKYYPYKDYMCADTNDGNINILSLEETHKTKEHCNMDLEELQSTICHEFVHICQQDCQREIVTPTISWYWEALATNLGNPEKFKTIELKISYEDLNDFNNLPHNYLIAFTIGKYMLEQYSHENILNYIKYPSLLIQDSKTIIEEAIEWSKKKNYKSL